MTADKYAAELASILAGCWPRAYVTDETVAVYAKVLAPEDDDVAENAVDRASRFDGPPSKKELEDVIRATRENMRPELPIAPEVSGRVVALDEMSHGHFHLVRYWATGATRDLRDPDEFEHAKRPWECGCTAWQSWAPPNPRIDRLYQPREIGE